jgi:serine/threonine-protein kinase
MAGLGIVAVIAGTPTAYTYFTGQAHESAQFLAAIGVTPAFYATFNVVFGMIVIVEFAIVGVLIFLRRSNDWMGLFVSIFLITFGLANSSILALGQNYVFISTLEPWYIWLIGSLAGFGWMCFMLFMFIFPDGRLVPRALLPVLIGLEATAFGWNFTAIDPHTPLSPVNWPPLAQIIFLVVASSSTVFAQIYRYRRVSSPAARQQTKWVVYGVALTFLGILLLQLPLIALSIFSQPGPLTTFYNLFLSAGSAIFLLPLPLTIGVSILRYRLWDLDFIINRSLVYGLLTVGLVGLLTGAFFGLRALLGLALGGEQSTIAIVVATVAVVTAFNPARRWLRHFVDQRLYGIHIDYRTPAAKPADSVAAPRSTLGDYHGLELIGRGGMAEVFRAQHLTSGRAVAIKVLPHALAQEADFRKRFEREARTVAALKHPNIVQMFDFGESDGTYYMVLEFLSGKDVGDLVRDVGPLPIERALGIVRDVASALDYAHQQGLVHRDIKPSNVMLDPLTASGTDSRTERAVLTDFGIARILGGGTRLTASGMIGTLDYISPEQIRDSKDVDGRADIYSLGIMAFQMLTGRLPFDASNPGALLIAHLQQPAPDPREFRPDLPEDACRAVSRVLEKEPDRRFQTAGEFAAALSA